jgi:hypothetical protein
MSGAQRGSASSFRTEDLAFAKWHGLQRRMIVRTPRSFVVVVVIVIVVIPLAISDYDNDNDNDDARRR